MRLISLHVENYRIHRSLKISFDSQRTVIGGRNETGKSTVMEAVHHALFLKSRVSGDVATLLQSVIHAGHPRVQLAIEVDGKQYTIEKEFRGGATAVSMLHEHAGETLRGEAAEARIHELLNATEASGGRGLKNRVRTRWAHLFCWQGEVGGDPVKSFTEGDAGLQLRNQLGSLGGGSVLESPLDVKIGQLLAERVSQTFTDRGAIRANSELGQAKQNYEASLAALENAREKVASVRNTADTIESASVTIRDCGDERAIIEEELRQIKRKQGEVNCFQLQLAEQQYAVKTEEAAFERLTDADEEIIEIGKNLEAAKTRIEPAEKAVEVLRKAVADANEQFRTLMEKVSACKKEQLGAKAISQVLDLCQHHARLLVEKAGLGGRCEQIQSLQLESQALLKKIESHVVVTSDDVEELVDLQRRQENAKATLDAIATRVEVLACGQSLTLDGRAASDGDSETITEPLMIELGSADGAEAVIRISPGGGYSVAEARADYQDAQQAFATRLQDLRVTDLPEARRQQAMRQELISERKAKEVAIDGLGSDQALHEFEVLKAEVTSIDAEISRRMPVDFTRPRPEEVEDFIENARQKSTLAEESWAAASDGLDAAKRQLDEAISARDQSDEALRQTHEEIRELEIRRHVLVEKFGEDQERSDLIAARAEKVQLVKQAVEETETQLAGLDPTGIRRDVDRCERSLARLAERQQEAETQLAIARNDLSREAGSDPQEQLHQALAHHDSAELQFQVLRNRWKAISLLKNLFVEKKNKVENQYILPLTTRVADYLSILYGPDTAVTVKYTGSQFEKLTISRGVDRQVLFQFSQLSGGTQQQVSAAFRLAMAEILAERFGGCLPLVFDDSFTDSDAVRMRGLQRMLDLAASRGLQVIVLSCRPEQYSGLGAATVMLPKDTAEPTANDS